MSACVALSRGKRSVSIRCQGYIGDFVLGCHAKDMVVLCFGKLICHVSDSAVLYLCTLRLDLGVFPSVDPYRSARQLVGAGTTISPRMRIEAPTPPLPPFFLPSLIRPPRTRAAMAQMRATAPSTYHLLLPSGTPPLLPIPPHVPSTSHRADIPEADTPPQMEAYYLLLRPSYEVGESSTAAAVRQPGPNMAH
ncbi:hypothetical protein Tco_1138654 [Tanacetum coccineum]